MFSFIKQVSQLIRFWLSLPRQLERAEMCLFKDENNLNFVKENISKKISYSQTIFTC